MYEQDFLECSYGFRPGRSAHDAIRALNRAVYQGKVRWILVRQANWQKVGGESPLERRTNQPRFSASPCVGHREGSGEASVAVHVGRLMSIETTVFWSAEAFRSAEGNTGGLAMVRGRRAPRCPRPHARMKAFCRDLGDLWSALTIRAAAGRRKP